jgi:hypothetical protein
MFSNNRIFISRIFAFIFLLIFFFSEPALENTGWEALLFLFGLILVGLLEFLEGMKELINIPSYSIFNEISDESQ